MPFIIFLELQKMKTFDLVKAGKGFYNKFASTLQICQSGLQFWNRWSRNYNSIKVRSFHGNPARCISWKHLTSVYEILATEDMQYTSCSLRPRLIRKMFLK